MSKRKPRNEARTGGAVKAIVSLGNAIEDGIETMCQGGSNRDKIQVDGYIGAAKVLETKELL